MVEPNLNMNTVLKIHVCFADTKNSAVVVKTMCCTNQPSPLISTYVPYLFQYFN